MRYRCITSRRNRHANSNVNKYSGKILQCTKLCKDYLFCIITSLIRARLTNIENSISKSYLRSRSLGATHFKGARGHVAAAAEPHLLHQLSVGLGDLAPHSQRVLSVDLRLVLVVEEVLGERRGVAQALGDEE